jgi:hypothetical protein
MIDKYSPTWRFIESSITSRIEALRTDLESVHLSDIESAIKRGNIQALRDVLLLVEIKPVSDTVENSPTSFY